MYQITLYLDDLDEVVFFFYDDQMHAVIGLMTL